MGFGLNKAVILPEGLYLTGNLYDLTIHGNITSPDKKMPCNRRTFCMAFFIFRLPGQSS